MSHKLLMHASLHGVLWLIDQDLAATCKAAWCPCGGRLDVASYPRKPRGGPDLPLSHHPGDRLPEMARAIGRENRKVFVKDLKLDEDPRQQLGL